MSAPFQLAPPPRSFLPLHPRVPATIEWPAPEPIALRRSNEWPAPDISTMAWADGAFAPVPEVAVPSLRQILAPPPGGAVPFAAPRSIAPPRPIDPPRALPAPAALVAPAPTPLAPPAPITAMPAATLAPPAPAARPLHPPSADTTPLPAPTTGHAPADDAPTDDAPSVELPSVELPPLAPPDPETAADDSAGGRKRLIRLQDAIITLSVAAATALLTLVLLSQL